MQADNSQLLSQLIDIHATGEPSAWPPAPGWWVLGLLLLLVLLWLAALLTVVTGADYLAKAMPHLREEPHD